MPFDTYEKRLAYYQRKLDQIDVNATIALGWWLAFWFGVIIGGQL